ncbi:MAG: protein disulfide oxidoreductase [Thiohalomonadaceae bacterium]
MTRKWLRLLWQALALFALVLAVGFWQVRDLASGMALPLAGAGLHGEPLDLAHWRGRPVVVHFWATWCPVCSLEDETIAAVAADHPVLTVAMQSGGAHEVAAHMRENGLEFPVLNDPDGALAARYGVRAVPTTFIIDGAGRIRFREVGYTTGPGLRLRLWLAD